jgi:hypothetical protein
MPKKPNAEIRQNLRDYAHALINIASELQSEADALQNAKPLKPRTKKHAPKVTKAMARNIKALAMVGWPSADIAAHFGVNQGRVTDVLNGVYD